MNTVVPIKNAVPAKASAEMWADQKRIEQVAEHLHDLCDFRDDLQRMTRRLTSGWDGEADLAEAKKLLARYDAEEINSSVELAEREFEGLEPSEWTNSEGEIQRPAVSKMLAYLVGSFPTSNLPNATVFTQAMLNDVMALDPEFVVLEAACRNLRKTQRFMPAICELIEEIEKQDGIWRKAKRGLLVTFDYTELKERVAACQAKQDQLRLEAEERAKPIEVDCIVLHKKLGYGIVTAIDDLVFETNYYVQFEGESEPRHVHRDFITRSIGPARATEAR